MQTIIHDAGYLLSHMLDILDRDRVVNPIYGAIKEDGSKIIKEIKEISLEISIPKAVNMIENNTENANSAVSIYPAELNDENNNRVSVLIVTIQKYTTNEYMIISQPYSFNDNKISTGRYELLDYYDFLEDDLEELEHQFVEGAFEHDRAQYLWEERFVG